MLLRCPRLGLPGEREAPLVVHALLRSSGRGHLDSLAGLRGIAWAAWAAWALLAGLAILLQIRTTEGFPAAWAPALALGGFMTVGAVVVSRQPRHTIGWLCCVAGLAGGVAGFSSEYARYALGPKGGWLPGGLAMAWLEGWVGSFWSGLVLSLLLLLFPTGRLLSRRWRPVAWACALCVTALCVVQAVKPGTLEVAGRRNPLGIDSAQATLERLQVLMILCFALLMLLCAGSVVVRFRRARGSERQQLNWFAYGTG
jgi:two-component system NarL family sensor kinase